jgi:hypothetical protein
METPLSSTELRKQNAKGSKKCVTVIINSFMVQILANWFFKGIRTRIYLCNPIYQQTFLTVSILHEVQKTKNIYFNNHKETKKREQVKTAPIPIIIWVSKLVEGLTS